MALEQIQLAAFAADPLHAAKAGPSLQRVYRRKDKLPQKQGVKSLSSAFIKIQISRIAQIAPAGKKGLKFLTPIIE